MRVASSLAMSVPSLLLFFLLLMASPRAVHAQDGSGDTTYLSAGTTYTASLDSDGDPVAPAPALLTSASTVTRTRGTHTVAVVFDSNEDVLFTQTLTGKTPTTSRTATSTAASTTQRPGGAAGGGGAPVTTTQASLQVISGYIPPPSSALPSPTAYRSGSILRPDQISGWSSFTSSRDKIPIDGRPVYNGGGYRVENSLSAGTAGFFSASRSHVAAAVLIALTVAVSVL